LLVKAGQSASASDLVLYLISTYELSQAPVDNVSRAKLAQLLKAFERDEPTLPKIAAAITAWAGKFGPIPYGDPELNHVIGTIFAGTEKAYEAEKYLLLGTKQSPKVLADLLYEWSTENESSSTALFASRGVFGYLCIKNIRDAHSFLESFLDLLPDNYDTVKEEGFNARVYNDHPLLNFLQLLIYTCQAGNVSMFSRLKLRYKTYLEQLPVFNDALERIGLLFFNIQPRRSNNVLQDLMGSLFAPPPGSTS
jgi:golgi to ER traffic protein 4